MKKILLFLILLAGGGHAREIKVTTLLQNMVEKKYATGYRLLETKQSGGSTTVKYNTRLTDKNNRAFDVVLYFKTIKGTRTVHELGFYSDDLLSITKPGKDSYGRGYVWGKAMFLLAGFGYDCFGYSKQTMADVGDFLKTSAGHFYPNKGRGYHKKNFGPFKFTMSYKEGGFFMSVFASQLLDPIYCVVPG